MNIVGIIFIIGLLAFTGYQIYNLVHEIRLRKKKSTTEENKNKGEEKKWREHP